MILPKLVIFTLTFYGSIIHLDALLCPKGQRSDLDNRGCENCPNGSYQPEENNSQWCKLCTQCEEDRGSFVKENCTKVTNRKCQCREGFLPWDIDASTCKCDIGSGLKNGVCTKCKEGYFNNRINSPCQKWKVCTSGVNKSGTTTSDVVCNVNNLESNLDITTVQSFITRITSHRPREKTTRTMTTTRSPPQRKVTDKEKVDLTSSLNPGNYIGMALLIFGIIGLLILTAVTCKLHITPCVQRNTAVQTKDSLCRRPVEESGDGSLSSLKLNPGEP